MKTFETQWLTILKHTLQLVLGQLFFEMPQENRFKTFLKLTSIFASLNSRKLPRIPQGSKSQQDWNMYVIIVTGNNSSN